MKAQVLYDLINQYAFCSGEDMHDFFSKMCADPSPSGTVDIDENTIVSFVCREAETGVYNSNSYEYLQFAPLVALSEQVGKESKEAICQAIERMGRHLIEYVSTHSQYMTNAIRGGLLASDIHANRDFFAIARK